MIMSCYCKAAAMTVLELKTHESEEIFGVIRRNTKFKFSKWGKSQSTTSIALFSLLVMPLAFYNLPAAGSLSPLPRNNSSNRESDSQHSNFSNVKLYSDNEKTQQISVNVERFTGVMESIQLPVPERPNLMTIGAESFNLPGLAENIKNILKVYSDKYKEATFDLHSLGDNDSTSVENTNRTKKAVKGYWRRQKRDVIYADKEFSVPRTRRKTLNDDSEGTFVINAVARATPQYYDSTSAVDINCQRIANKNYVISLEDVENKRVLMIHQLNEKNLGQKLMFQTEAPNAISAEVLKIKDETFVFTTVKHDPHATDTIKRGSNLYRINFANGTFDFTQAIHVPYIQSSSIWQGMGEEANELFLAIAPSKDLRETGFSYNVKVPYYRWQGGYFDFMSHFPASNPQSITHFSMFSHDYLAVANYQDDSGSTSIHSEIFKYQHSESGFVSFQKIQTYGAKDIRHFTFESADGRRKEHFIAIANNCKKDEAGTPQFWIQSTIMKFGELRFMPFKSFYSYGAMQFLPVKHGNKFFLALADLHGIRMFQYNGWTFVQTHSIKYQIDQTSPFPMNLRELNTNDKSYIVVATNTMGVKNGMFAVNYETRNDHRQILTSVEGWCREANKQFRLKNTTEIEEKIDSSPKITNEKVLVDGTITFETGVKIDELKSQALRMGTGRSLGEHEFSTMALNEKRFGNLRMKLESIKTKLGHVVWVDKNQVVKGNINFQNLQYLSNILQIKNLQVVTLSSANIANHLDNIVHLDKPQRLNGITVKSLKAPNLEVMHLNDRSLDSYALKKPPVPQTFLGRNEFLSQVFIKEQIKVANNFAGLPFPKEPSFLLASNNQTFPETTLHFSGTRIENLYTNILNGNDVEFHFSDAVHLSGGFIQAEKHIQSVDIGNAEATMLNNLPIQLLYDNSIYINGKVKQRFEGPTYIEALEIGRLDPTNSEINQKFDLSSDFIKVHKGNYKLSEIKIEGSTKIKEIAVENNINNIKVSDGKLQIFFKKSEDVQHLQNKEVQTIQFTKDVQANELVDGISLSSWSEVQNIQLNQNHIQGLVSVKGNIKFMDDLLISKSFQQENSDVLNILNQIASIDSPLLPGSCDLIFENLEVKGNSDFSGQVNGVKPSQWVVNSPSHEVTIVSNKKFTNDVRIQKDVEAEALFGMEKGGENIFHVLPNMVLDGVDQTITQPMKFTGFFQANKAFCPKTILNGIPFENLLFKKGNQVVSVVSIFKQQPLIAIDGSSIVGEIQADFINGIKFKEELEDTLRTGQDFGEQIVTADYTFSELSTTSSEVRGSFANSEVESVFGNIVLKNAVGFKELSATQVFFHGGVTLDHLDFLGKMNGISSGEWGNVWMLNRGDQSVTTNVEFLGTLTGTNVEAPSINQIDIEKLSSDIVRIDSDEALHGVVTFMDPVKVEPGVVTGNDVKINDVNLRKDVLLKSSPSLQTVKGEKHFISGVTISDHLFVKRIPNFDIANFTNLLNSDNGLANEPFPSLVVNGKVTMEKEPGVQNSFNGHNWNDLKNKIWFRDQDVMLNSHLEFASLTLKQGGDMDTAAKVNGMNLDSLQLNYASKSRDQEWTGSVTMKNVNGIDFLTTNYLSIQNGLFNNVDVKEFYGSVLRYTGNQIVHGKVKVNNLKTNNLDTTGSATINSKSFSDFMTISGENIVNSPKNFESINAKTIVLTPETVIDGVKIAQWNENAVKRNGAQQILGPVQFSELRTTDNVEVNGLVDGIKYDTENILTTDMDQEIFGEVTIVQDSTQPEAAALTALGGLTVEGNLNGVNVQKSIKNLVFKNIIDETPIRIRAEVEFNSPVVLKNVETEAHFQGHDVGELMSKFSRAHDETISDNFNGKEQYEKLLNIANRMLRVSEKRAMFLNHFVLTQTIQVPSIYMKVLRKIGYPAIAVGFKKSAQTTTENWWSYSPIVDYYQLQIGNRIQFEGVVSDIAELQTAQDHMFVFAVNSDQDNRPVNTSLETMASATNFEINKSEGKGSKAFVLRTVDVGTSFSRPAVSQIIYSQKFKSVRSFSVSSHKEQSDCILVTTDIAEETEKAVKVFCLSGIGELNSVQEISLDSPSITTSVSVLNTTLLGILTRTNDGQPEGLLEIWSDAAGKADNSIKFSKQHCLPVFNAVSLNTISTNDGKTFLAVASGTLRKSEYKGSVFIYRYSETLQEFKKMQTIEVDHPVDVKMQWLKRSNEVVIYILSDSVTNNVHVYKYQGLSGWNLIHQFTSERGKSIEVTDFTLDGVYRAQLLVTNPTETHIYSAEFTGINNIVEETFETLETMKMESSSLHETRIDVNNL